MFNYSVQTLVIFTAVTGTQALTCGSTDAVMPPEEFSVESRPQDFPWLARLNVRCTATILGKQWLITAAHCVYSDEGILLDPKSLSVTFGDLLLSSTDNNERVLAVDRIIPHPLFDPISYDYDFAMIHLSEKLTWSDSIKPICLIQSCDSEAIPTTNLTCIIAGWGSDRVSYLGGDESLLDNELRKQLIKVIPRDYCSNVMTNQPYLGAFLMTRRQVCAGYPQGSVDDCQSDSGGPLICMDKTQNTFYLHGINSYGFGCGLPRNYYRIFSRPCTVTNWIVGTSQRD